MKKFTIEDLMRELETRKMKSMGDGGFCVIDVRYGEGLDNFLKNPFSFDGVLAFYCIGGKFKITVNMKEFDIEPGTFFINVPNNVMNISSFGMNPTAGLRFVMIAISRQYMSKLHLDMNMMFLNGVSVLDNPSINVGDQEKEFAEGYLRLMEKIENYPSPYQDGCFAGMISSACYIIAAIREKKLHEVIRPGIESQGRNKVIVSKFLKLVSEHHMSERSVGFYADKLCLTPKYLSKLIKNATGRSAPQWIDEFVIVEAKNLLKYSDVPIKEIVFRLNFPNQSVFHKYFKAHVGMTPGQFRR